MKRLLAIILLLSTCAPCLAQQPLVKRTDARAVVPSIFPAADIKITDLPAATAATSDDLLVMVDAPGSAPATKKITVGNFVTSIFNAPTIVTPTIASFVNATHGHTSAAGGGQLNATSIFSTGTVPVARLPVMIGDSGSGGTAGLVPAPAAGDAAAGKFLKADGSWVAPSGSGDVSSNTSSSVDGELALFNGTTGKAIKRASTTGLLKAASGVIGAAVSGSDYAPATSGSAILKGNGAGGFSAAAAGTDYSSPSSTESLTNKTFDTASNTFRVSGSTVVSIGSGLSIAGGVLSATLVTGGGASATSTYDPPSLTNGQSDSIDVTLTDADIGDPVVLSFTTTLPAGVWFSTPQVIAADTVRITLVNESGTTQNIASGTLKVTALGTVVPLAQGGLGIGLSAPAGNRILGWDNTDAASAFFTIGSGLSYDHATHTLSATGGGGGSSAWDALTAPTGNLALDLSTHLSTFTANTAITNAVNRNFIFGHDTSGTAATGFGLGFLAKLETTTTTGQDAGAFDFWWSDATHASRTSRAGIATVTSGGSLSRKLIVGNTASQTSTFLFQNQDTLSSGDLVQLYISDPGFKITAGYGAPLTISDTVGTNIVYNVSFPQKHSFQVSTVEVLAVDNSVIVTPASAGTKGLIVKAFASQTASLQEWQNSGGTALNLVDASGNFLLGTSTSPTANAGKVLVFGDNGATNPTLGASTAAIFNKSGELQAMDASGNVTPFSPHYPGTDRWRFYSCNVNTGRCLEVDMENLVKTVERLSGKTFMTEWRDK